ncbi:MAG TPA: phosphotransferase [Acidimicrobiia bacterium]|nr:phosphotransferase [Acidimicrobiia bacterium]
MLPTEEILVAARRALPAWGCDPASVRLIVRGENLSCAVVADDGERFVLRMHRPGYNDRIELESEVAWVRSLADAGLDVARAVPTLEGSHHITVELAGEHREIGLVSWVEGTPVSELVDEPDADLEAWYRQIGEIAARIRTHTERWEPPPWFRRRRWDADGLVGERPLWGRFWDCDLLDAATRRLLVEARREMRVRLADLEAGPGRFGLIHADLNLGNLLLDGDVMTVIDFDDAGFGFHAHELAVALQPLSGSASFETARRSLVEGYRSEHQIDEADLDLFVAMRSLMLVGWYCARPEVRTPDRLARAVGRAEAASRALLGR